MFHLFAGTPEFVHQNQQGVYWFLTPLKGTQSQTLSFLIGDGIYLDVFVALVIATILTFLIVVVPLYALSRQSQSERFGLFTVSLITAFMITVLVIGSSLTISRIVIIIWELSFAVALCFILGILLILKRIKKP